MLVPSLWKYEVGNFLGRVFPGQASEKMALIVDLNLTGLPLAETAHRLCFVWMERHGVTFYNACYLTLAEETKSILVTADAKFAEKMNYPKSLRLLKNL